VHQWIPEKKEDFLTQRFLLVFKKNSHPLSWWIKKLINTRKTSINVICKKGIKTSYIS
jgi:hypothetical protein